MVHGRRDNGLGYMAALERFLDGGRNFVRLNSCRLAFGDIDQDELRGRTGSYFNWLTERNGDEFSWRTDSVGDTFLWFEGSFVNSYTHATLANAITIQGVFPPGGLLAIPGEFITLYTAANPNGETHMVSAPVYATSVPGTLQTATVRLVTTPTGGGRADLGTSETGIFELTNQFPDLGRPGADVPDFELQFREVFPQEIAEGYFERNPWI